jgi:hypothetical protein
MAKGKGTAGSIGSAIADKRRKVAAKASDAAAAASDAGGPSANPMTNVLLADIALRGGGQLLRHAVERAVLGVKYSPDTAKKIVKGRSMGQTLIGTALARIATRSVPGALIVGGGLLAKTLYDHTRDRRAARAEGEAKVAEQAAKGEDA